MGFSKNVDGFRIDMIQQLSIHGTNDTNTVYSSSCPPLAHDLQVKKNTKSVWGKIQSQKNVPGEEEANREGGRTGRGY